MNEGEFKKRMTTPYTCVPLSSIEEAKEEFWVVLKANKHIPRVVRAVIVKWFGSKE